MNRKLIAAAALASVCPGAFAQDAPSASPAQIAAPRRAPAALTPVYPHVFVDGKPFLPPSAQYGVVSRPARVFHPLALSAYADPLTRLNDGRVVSTLAYLRSMNDSAAEAAALGYTVDFGNPHNSDAMDIEPLPGAATVTFSDTSLLTYPDGRIRAQGVVASNTPLLRTWEVTAGNSYISGKVGWRVQHGGKKDGVTLAASANVSGKILNRERTLAQASANLSAPLAGKGNLTTAVNLNVAGYDLIASNKSTVSRANAKISDTGRKEISVTFLEAGFDWSIAGYGVSAYLAAYGAAGLSYTANAWPGTTQLLVGPYVEAGIKGDASANVGFASASLDSKLVLVSYAPLFGAHTVHQGSTIAVYRGLDHSISLLAGYAKIKVKAFGASVGSWTIWNESEGLYRVSGNAFKDNFTVRL